MRYWPHVRSSGEAIPGCTGNGGGNNWDYCYYTAEFQDRYADTVVSRIFYVYDRNDTTDMTPPWGVSLSTAAATDYNLEVGLWGTLQLDGHEDSEYCEIINIG